MNHSLPTFSILAAIALLAAQPFIQDSAWAQHKLTSPDVHFEQGELIIGGKTIRLYGIHFPTQPGICSKDLNGCRDLGLQALTDWLAETGPVECEVLSVTRSEAHIARCRRDEIDLGAWLIGHGYALADRRGGRAYLRFQQAARSESAGLWRDDWLLAGHR